MRFMSGWPPLTFQPLGSSCVCALGSSLFRIDSLVDSGNALEMVLPTPAVFTAKARKFIGPVFLVMSVVDPFTATQTDAPKYQNYLTQGLEFQKEGRFSDAEKAYAMALSEAERQFGPEHFCVAEILNQLAAIRTEQHDYSAALTAFERSLNITEKILGSQSVQVGLVLTNIAMIYQHQNRYAMAESNYKRAMSTLEGAVGPAHRFTARAQMGMAMLRLAQHRYSDAEDLLERIVPVLETFEQSDDPTLLIALTNLAESYRIDGRYSQG